MCKVLMSINPEHVNNIMSGKKYMNLEKSSVRKRLTVLLFIQRRRS